MTHFCSMRLIHIVQNYNSVACIVFTDAVCFVLFLHRMEQRNPGTSCVLMTGKTPFIIYCCMETYQLILHKCTQRWCSLLMNCQNYFYENKLKNKSSLVKG